MIGFRKVTGLVLAGSVLLAGCEEAAVGDAEQVLSKTENTEIISVVKDCQAIDLTTYETFNYSNFIMHPESIGFYPVSVSSNSPEVVFLSLELETLRPCYFRVSLSDDAAADDAKVSISFIFKTDWGLSAKEKALFDDAVFRCEQYPDPLRKFAVFTRYFSLEHNASLSNGSFVGCTRMIQNQMLGFNLIYDDSVYRILSVTGLINVMRIK